MNLNGRVRTFGHSQSVARHHEGAHLKALSSLTGLHKGILAMRLRAHACVCVQVAELSEKLSAVSQEKTRLESRNSVLEKVRHATSISMQMHFKGSRRPPGAAV